MTGAGIVISSRQACQSNIMFRMTFLLVQAPSDVSTDMRQPDCCCCGDVPGVGPHAGEGTDDTDLVAWVSVGLHHLPRSEDIPVVTNMGAGFALKPWNFYNGLPSRDIKEAPHDRQCAPRADVSAADKSLAGEHMRVGRWHAWNLPAACLHCISVQLLGSSTSCRYTSRLLQRASISIESASHAGAARSGRRILQDLASSVRHQLHRALLAARLRV